MKVYLEVGQKKVFAVALDWFGLARSAKTEDAALKALAEYVPRYRASMGAAAEAMEQVTGATDLQAVDRLPGNKTTDFGAPSAIHAADRLRMSDAEIQAALVQMQAAWDAFTAAADLAEGKELGPSGPRGGGRSLEKMRNHVSGADGGYTGAVGGKSPSEDAPWPDVQVAFMDALRRRNAGELPDYGPRGGERWPARFAIRRSAWHALDHAWEIQDRVTS